MKSLVDALDWVGKATKTSIGYEGIPRDQEGVHFSMEVREDGQKHTHILREPPFVMHADPALPALASVTEAVAANNARGESFARYRVDERDGYLDVVPTSLRIGTRWVAYHPILDAEITLPTARGTRNDLYREITRALRDDLGLLIADDMSNLSLDGRPCGNWKDGPCDKIELRSATAPARVLLDEVVSGTGHTTSWNWISLQGTDEWVLLLEWVGEKPAAVVTPGAGPR